LFEQRKLLTEELKELAGKGDRLNAEHRQVKNEAIAFKNLRDECNARVRNLGEDLKTFKHCFEKRA
jgi:uncharacterized coiled-coil DUF342 family protein